MSRLGNGGSTPIPCWAHRSSGLPCSWQYCTFSFSFPVTLLILYSVLIPWFTLREVPVEVEIVIHPLVFTRNSLTYRFSHRPKSLFFVSTAGCSKVFWAESAAPRSWSTTLLESSARAGNLHIIIWYAAFKATLQIVLLSIHLNQYGLGSWSSVCSFSYLQMDYSLI